MAVHDPRRRRILRATGLALAVGLAGCTGDGDDDDDAGDDSNGDAGDDSNGDDAGESGDGVDAEQAQSDYDDAVADLAAASDTLDDWAVDEPDRDDTDVESLRDDVEGARSTLEDAEEIAPEDLLDDVDAALATAEFQSTLLDYHDLAIQFDEVFGEAVTHSEAGDSESAAPAHEDALGIVDDIEATFQDVRSALDSIDRENWEESNVDVDGDAIDWVPLDDEGETGVIRSFVEGYYNFDSAWVDVLEGLHRIDESYQGDEDRFDDARERFEDALSHYDEAETQFQNARGNQHADDNIQAVADAYLSDIGETREAFELFVGAAEAAEAGNHQEADTLLQDGNQILEDAQM